MPSIISCKITGRFSKFCILSTRFKKLNRISKISHKHQQVKKTKYYNTVPIQTTVWITVKTTTNLLLLNFFCWILILFVLNRFLLRFLMESSLFWWSKNSTPNIFIPTVYKIKFTTNMSFYYYISCYCSWLMRMRYLLL